MADVHSRETAAITCQELKARTQNHEMLVRRFLHANGFRYRLHVKDLPGKPDIVLPKYKMVIFVHARLPVGRAVFGMGMKAVNIMLSQKQELNGS